MSDEAAPASGRALFNEIGARLAPRGVQTGAMFGMPCLKTGGKAFAGFYHEAMVFKLPPDGVATALALPGAHLFDPGMGRPMKEWVQVPPDHAAQWPALAEQARRYVLPKA